jgi:alcohol-forming fatty acyl-CoA reductase
MLLKEAGDLPVSIVRPSIVLSSINEPLSGWVDNWNGPTGIVSAVGKGIFHTIMCNAQSVADFIPVDLVSTAPIRTAIKRFHNYLSKGYKSDGYGCMENSYNKI